MVKAREHSVALEDGMRVKHNTKARIVAKSGNRVLEDSLTDVESIGGALTRMGIVYNRLCMSGGVSWWEPATGRSIARPKISILLRPQDILVDSEECDCQACGALS